MKKLFSLLLIVLLLLSATACGYEMRIEQIKMQTYGEVFDDRSLQAFGTIPSYKTEENAEQFRTIQYAGQTFSLEYAQSEFCDFSLHPHLQKYWILTEETYDSDKDRPYLEWDVKEQRVVSVYGNLLGQITVGDAELTSDTVLSQIKEILGKEIDFSLFQHVSAGTGEVTFKRIYQMGNFELTLHRLTVGLSLAEDGTAVRSIQYVEEMDYSKGKTPKVLDDIETRIQNGIDAKLQEICAHEVYREQYGYVETLSYSMSNRAILYQGELWMPVIVKARILYKEEQMEVERSVQFVVLLP